MKLCQASVSINCDLRVDSPGPGGIRSGDTEPYDINISNATRGLNLNMSLTFITKLTLSELCLSRLTDCCLSVVSPPESDWSRMVLSPEPG